VAIRPASALFLAASAVLVVCGVVVARSEIAEPARDRYFDACLEAGSIAVRAQPSDRRAAFLADCDTAARAATIATPSYGRAWLALAAVSAELGNRTDFRATLAMAQAVAPAVAWQADRRMALALQYGDTPTLDSDIAALLANNAGIAALAARYVAQPDLRPRFIAVAERAPSAAQWRFLAAVRTAGGVP
jgi:hypothetical protein